MGWRTNNILLVVAILLGIACVIDVHHLRTTEEREKAERNIFDFEEGALRAFEVTRDEEVFALEKGADSLWYVTKPIRYRADQAAAEAFEFELRTLRKKFDVSVDDTGDLEVYGLAEPRLRLRFWITDEPQEVGVGNEVPEGDVYIRVGGAEPAVYTVRSSFHDTLARDLKDLRDKRLLPFETYNVQALALEEGAWRVEWLKTDDGWTTNSAGVSDRADPGKIDTILRRIQNLKAYRFHDDVTEKEMEEYGLGGAGLPPRKIHISLKNDTNPLMAEVGVAQETPNEIRVPGRRLRGESPNTVLLLPREALEDFGRDFSEFRSRTAVPFSSYEVESFSVRRGEDDLTVSQEEGNWKITAPREADAEAAEVDSFLRMFEELEIAEFVHDRVVDLGPYGLGRGAAEISIRTQDSEVILRYSDPQADQGRVFGILSGTESVVALGVESLPTTPSELGLMFLKRRVLDYSTRDAKLLQISEDDRVWEFEKKDGKWMAGEKEDLRAGEVVLSLSSLQAMRFVDDRGTGRPYGLDEPALVVKIQEKDAEYVVSFGDMAEPAGRYAQVKGSEMIFVASPILYDEILELTRPVEDEPSEPPPEDD